MSENSLQSAVEKMARLGHSSPAVSNAEGINTAASADVVIETNSMFNNNREQLSLPIESATPSIHSTVQLNSTSVIPTPGDTQPSGVNHRNMDEQPSSGTNHNNNDDQAMQIDATAIDQHHLSMPSGSALSRFLAEQGPTTLPTVNPYEHTAPASQPAHERTSLRDRVLGPRASRNEMESYRRGLLFANRWLLDGIDTRWDDLYGQTRGDALLGSQVTNEERAFRDYQDHLAVDTRDIYPHSQRRFTAYAEEHLLRLRVSGVLLSSLVTNATYFDVPYLRRRTDAISIKWWTFPHFAELANALDSMPSEQVTRVSKAVLGPYFTLCEHDGVPWERYLLEVSSDTVDESILASPPYRTVAPPPVHYAKRDGHDVLVIKKNLQAEDGSYLGFTCVHTPIREEVQTYTPETWRRQERRNRHRFERFTLGHQCEVDLLRRRAIMSLYPALPRWWSEVEVPYGFLPETPRMLYYLGLREQVPRRLVWDIYLRSEWALCCATHLIYEARAGRLWWLPYELRCDIRTLGLHDPSIHQEGMPYTYTTREREMGLATQLSKLLEFIDMIAWERIPSDGIIPEYPELVEDFSCSGGVKPEGRIGVITPVHRSADWVIFDPEHWCLQLPNKYFVEFSNVETGAYNPEHPRLGRVYDQSDSRYRASTAEDDWRARTRERLQRNDDVMESSTPPVSGPSTGRISRPRARTSSIDSSQLLDQLAREGITDVDSLVARLRGVNPSEGGPSRG